MAAYGALIAAIVGAASATYGGVKQEQARQAADTEAGKAAGERQVAENKAKKKLEEEEATAQADAARAAQRQAFLARRRIGRSGTLLTQQTQAAGSKTLLGA